MATGSSSNDRDPGAFGLVTLGVATAFGVARSAYGLVEDAVLRQLKERLDHLDGRGDSARRPGGATPVPPPGSPAALLDALLERSLEQSPEEAEREVFVSLLGQLVPDEARLLAAFSEGDGFPIVHVSETTAFGGVGRRVLSYQSNLAQAAAVQCRERTPHHLAHLVTLGLLEAAPEDPALAEAYEILDGHTEVRRTLVRLEAGGRRGRVLRRSLRLSELGAALWAACRPAPEGR